MQKDRTIKHFPKGEHGYNPKETEDMHGVFYAKGPNIKSNVHLDSFENIHIKAFILKIFGLSTNSSDGDGRVLSGLMTSKKLSSI